MWEDFTFALGGRTSRRYFCGSGRPPASWPATPSARALRAALSESAARCLSVFSSPRRDFGSWGGTTAAAPGTATGLRIDHIYLTDDLIALRHRTVLDKVGPRQHPTSDHAPVVVKILQWPEKNIR